MERIKTFLNKYFVLILYPVLSFIIPFLFTDLGLIGYQFGVGIFLTFLGIPILLIHTLCTAKHIRIIVGIVMVTLGVILIVDITNINPITEKFQDEYTIEETDQFLLLRADGYKLLRLDYTNELIYDVGNPLEVYVSVKKDRLGTTVYKNIKIKSNLMDDYVYPQPIETH